MPHSLAVPTTPADPRAFAEHVAYYLSLTPRQLPSQYLYDELGSALFEAICCLPWYRIARLEHELLRRHASEIFTRLDGLRTLVELGPGNGEKLAALVDGPARGPLTVHLVDVSAHALGAAVRTLNEARDLAVVAHQATYEAGLLDAMKERAGGGRTLVLFLGSNIGNFDPPGADAFLRGVRAAMTPGDAILLGADLVKPEQELLLAYDDPLGVTAAFNKNLLVRANRELGADFNIDGFAHRAVWNREMSRIEMHLVSRRPQHVRVSAARLDITFDTGETIWTESSYKYRPAGVLEMLDRAGFSTLDQWVADGFALTLAGNPG
jgi:dimethylhistidine N-methyltransferase